MRAAHYAGARLAFLVLVFHRRSLVPTLPDATLHLFEQSGHPPFFDEPERVAAVVTDWTSRQR